MRRHEIISEYSLNLKQFYFTVSFYISVRFLPAEMINLHWEIFIHYQFVLLIIIRILYQIQSAIIFVRTISFLQ